MNMGIYYFTRTGNSKRVAEKIGEKLHITPVELKDDVNWKGIGAYFKFQAYVKGKKELRLQKDLDVSDKDRLIVVFPVWGSRMPPTVTAFLREVPVEKVDLVATSMGDRLKGGEVFHHCITIRKIKKAEDQMIEAYLKNLPIEDQ